MDFFDWLMIIWFIIVFFIGWVYYIQTREEKKNGRGK